MNYDGLIEKIMQIYTSADFGDDIREAKGFFSEVAGSFDEASQDFEQKMAQFTDWYVFTRKIKGTEQVPVELCLEDVRFPMTEDERSSYFNLRNSRHSIFEFLKVKGGDVYIKDMFTGFHYVIKDSQVTLGFNRNELFEARLIPHDGRFVFSNSFCFHPSQVSRFIAKEIKKVGKRPEAEQGPAREELIARLFKMKHKHGQYRHLDIKDVYSNDSKLRL